MTSQEIGKMLDKFRPSRPYGWGKAVLTPAQRDEIKNRYQAGETATSLAAAFEVSYGTITHMVDRRA